MDNKLSLVIPCFNEAKSLENLILRCVKLSQEYKIKFILVNNGSNDNTKEIFEEYKKKYTEIKFVELDINKGYGYGILFGLKHANSDYLGWTHADLQTDPEDVLKSLKLISPNDVELKFIKGIRKKRKVSDNIFTIGMAIIESFLFKTRLWDINAQPTIFSKSFYLKWEKPPTDFSLDLYAYVLAKKMQIKINRIPVKFNKRQYGESSWNTSLKQRYKFIKRTLIYSLDLRKILNENS